MSSKQLVGTGHVPDLDGGYTLDGSEYMHVVDRNGNSRRLPILNVAALAGSLSATAELIRDTIAAALVQSGLLTVVNNDAGDTITLGVSTEAVQDAVLAVISALTGASGGIVVNYDDAGNAETIGLLSSAFQTLTDQATIAWDMSAGFNAKVTLGGTRTLGTPTNPVEGRTYTLIVKQDATGSRGLTLPASFDFGSAGAPTFSTGANKADKIYLQCTDAVTPAFDATFKKAA